MKNFAFLVLVFLLSGCVDEVAYSIEAYIKESPEVKSNNFVFKQVDETTCLSGIGGGGASLVAGCSGVLTNLTLRLPRQSSAPVSHSSPCTCRPSP